jgi:membrane-associated phospholipid phosphatase
MEQQSPQPPGHVAEPATSPSHAAVLKEILPDLWRFVSLDSAVVLSVGATAAVLGSTWDSNLAREIATNTTLNKVLAPGYNAFEPGSRYGAFAFMLGGTYGVYAVGRLSGHPHVAVVGADLFRAQIVTQAWVQAIKFTVQRERPDQSNDVSFPSGHSAGGFAVAGVLTRHYGLKAAVPSLLGASYIAAARIHDNKHFLSDVIFGAAMGFAGARTVMLSNGRYGLVVTPSLLASGVFIQAALVAPEHRPRRKTRDPSF